MKKCVWLLACLSAAAANTPTAVILPDNLDYRLFKLLPKADVQNVLDMPAVTLRSLHPPLLGRLERWGFFSGRFVSVVSEEVPSVRPGDAGGGGACTRILLLGWGWGGSQHPSEARNQLHIPQFYVKLWFF